MKLPKEAEYMAATGRPNLRERESSLTTRRFG